MTRASLSALVFMAWMTGAVPVHAQGAGAQGADSIDPAVNTSQAPAPPASPAPVQTPALTGGANVPVAVPAAASSTPRAPPAAPARGGVPAAAGAAAPADPAAGSNDRAELQTTEISGNSELPKLLYIVPWQRAEVGRMTGRPPNSLVDEALTPVDRTVFARQNDYYSALQAASAQSGARPAASQVAPAAAPAAPMAPRDEK